jgi:hypothetical protein
VVHRNIRNIVQWYQRNTELVWLSGTIGNTSVYGVKKWNAVEHEKIDKWE